MPLKIGRRTVVLLAATALTATAAGIGWASVPDSSGQIHACYQKSTGFVRVIDTPGQQCRGGEVPLNWSQGGPSATPAGTAYEAYRELGDRGNLSRAVTLSFDWTTLAHLDLPAGSWTATANVSLFNHSDQIYFARCRVNVSSGRHSDAYDSIHGVQFGSQAMTVGVSLTSPGGVDLQCKNDSLFPDSQPLEADGWDLTVVPVGGLNSSAQ